MDDEDAEERTDANDDNDDDNDSVLLVGPYGRRDEARWQRTVGYLLNMLVYKYEVGLKGMAGWTLEEVARESGRVVAETMERGGMYPFGRLMREAGVREAERLMDVMFVWTTGQDIGQRSGRGEWSQRASEAKNLFTVSCDGAMLVMKATSESAAAAEVLLGCMLRANFVEGELGRTGASALALTLRRTTVAVGSQLQEEEWGTGLTTVAVLGDESSHGVSTTFQSVVRRCLRQRERTRLVDVRGCVMKETGQGRMQAGSVVGMHMRRSEALLWVVYSCVWQGFAFLPLDDLYSIPIVSHRLEHSEARTCFMDQLRPCFANSGPVLASKLSLMLSMNHVDLHKVPDSNLGYILYTSGTTGNPKGAMISQANVVNFLFWCQKAVVASSSDTFHWQASISFDTLIGNIAVPFLFGSKLMASEAASEIPMSCTLLWFTPSHLQVCLRSKRSWPHVRLAILGGEALSSSMRTNMKRTMPNAVVKNVYGPTETTVIVTSEDVSGYHGPPRSASIGRSLRNTINAIHRKTLFIGGKSVGLGYVKNEQTTKSKFLYDSATNAGIGNAYDSNDLVSFLPNGVLKHNGRLDDQVKISGQRVELGAVESAVMSCPGVLGCAVIATEGGAIGGSKSLAAFAVIHGDDHERKDEKAAAAIQQHVAGRVARHEVPHRIVIVDSIPLTTAGKADRKALAKMLISSNALIETPLAVSSSESLRESNVTKKGLTRSNSRKLVMQAFERVTGSKMDPSRSLWQQGLTSLHAMTLDAEVEKDSGVKVGFSAMLKDGSLDGIASVLDRSIETPQDLLEQDLPPFPRIRRFGMAGNPIMVFISSFGMLAETATDLIQKFTSKFHVLVFEFAGVDQNPPDLVFGLANRCEETEMILVRLVVAHSAGAAYAFEVAKLLKERTPRGSPSLWLLDSYLPVPGKIHSHAELLRFMMDPFRKLLKLSDLSNVPDDYLSLMFQTLLHKLGFSEDECRRIVSFYESNGIICMYTKMNSWTPQGKLSCNVNYIQSSDGKEGVIDSWAPYFSKKIRIFKTKAGHFDMLGEAALLMIKHE